MLEEGCVTAVPVRCLEVVMQLFNNVQLLAIG